MCVVDDDGDDDANDADDDDCRLVAHDGVVYDQSAPLRTATQAAADLCDRLCVFRHIFLFWLYFWFSFSIFCFLLIDCFLFLCRVISASEKCQVECWTNAHLSNRFNDASDLSLCRSISMSNIDTFAPVLVRARSTIENQSIFSFAF